MKKALLYMLFLLPLLATAQAPTNSTTQLPGSTAFSPTGWRYVDSNQVQMYNSALSKYYQLVTGKQFNNYIGTSTQNALNGKLDTTSTAQTKSGSLGVGITATSTSKLSAFNNIKANGEQFGSASGESIYASSPNIVESQSGGTGVSFDPSQTFTAIKFTTSASASYLQGINIRIKAVGTLTTTSAVTIQLYTDVAGVPTSRFSTGQVFAPLVGTSFAEFAFTLQNTLTPVSPNTSYWAVITVIESGGGHFEFDSQAGTGTTFQGASLATLTESNSQIYNIIYARGAYGIHAVADNSHAVWAYSKTGVAIRGDSYSHFGGYFTSVNGEGLHGESRFGPGITAGSTYNNALVGTSANTSGYAGVYANNTAGYVSLYSNGTNTFVQPNRSNTNTLMSITQGNHTGGAPIGINYNAGTLTGLTAGAELFDVVWGLNKPATFNTGDISSQRSMVIFPRTYNFVGPSTITNAATLAIAGDPISGPNATINYPWALWVQKGKARFQGATHHERGLRADSTIYSKYTGIANGEQFYAPSGENYYSESGISVQAQNTGTGTDYTPSTIYQAIRFTTSSDVSFVQGVRMNLKKTGALTNTSTLTVSLYTDVAGVPTTRISTGVIYGGQVSTVYNQISATVQNVTTPLSPSTQYWLVIQRTESGGAFVLNSGGASTNTFDGNSLASLSATANNIFFVLYNRNYYGLHAVANHSHGVWSESETGVGGRFGSNTHYGVYTQSNSGDGILGVSTYGRGGAFQATNNNSLQATSTNTIGYSAAYFENTAGYTSLISRGQSLFTQPNKAFAGTFVSLTQGAHTGGLQNGFMYNGGAWTNGQASTEAVDFGINLNRTVFFAPGNIGTQRAVAITAPTYASTGASVITTAATVSINAAPSAGPNMTITNPYALYVQAGVTRLQGNAQIDVGLDATGDLHYRNANGTFNRLGIGTDGQVLTVSGGAPSWSSAASTTEGTWTPTSNATLASSSGRYTKIGNMVYASFEILGGTNSSGTALELRSLPFTNSANSKGSVSFSSVSIGTPIVGQLNASQNFVIFLDYSGVSIPISQLNNKTIAGTVIYSTSN